VFASPSGPACLGPQAVAEEVAEHLPALAERRGLDAALLFAALSVMPVDWRPSEDYDAYRQEAERRIGVRDVEDCPSVALALAHSLPIWSQDKDMEAFGVRVYTTGDLLDAMR
jgi:predicted nucleic acid-binding protein